MSRLNRWILVLSTYLAQGCVAAGPEIYVDDRFDQHPDEVHAIEAAQAEWVRRTNGLAAIELVWHYRLGSLGPGHRIMVRYDSPVDGGVEYGYDQKVVAIKTELEEHIYVNVAYKEKVSIFATVLHEFGHHLGAHHVEDVDSVMYPWPMQGDGWCLTRQDLASYCAGSGLGCRAESLAPCTPAPATP